MKKKKAIIVFVKYPELGKVKTRLALTTSDKFALGVYQIIARYIFNSLEEVMKKYDVYIFYSQYDHIEEVKNWVNKNFYFVMQTGNDLGQKISNSFKNLFTEEYRSVVIIGSDIPDFTPKLIIEAFEKLENNDVVISPSDDGGYSLLGLNDYREYLFQDIEWSTNSVFIDTMEKIKNNDLNYFVLDELIDIDTENELVSWMKKSNNKQLVAEISNLARKEVIKV